MKIRVQKLEDDKEPVISHVWCIYKSERCVVLCVDLHKKYQKPSAYQGSSVWFGNECLMVDELPFDAMIKAETARYTAFVTLFDKDLVEEGLENISWQDDRDGYSEE